MREPVRVVLHLGERATRDEVLPVIRRAALGPLVESAVWPAWLKPHQVAAARRLLGGMRMFGGALLADAVGLGKTYVALALARRYRSVTAVVPAAITPQWRRLSRDLGVPLTLLSHEALSRGHSPEPTALFVIDEAHRFRNPDTQRYDTLARAIGRSHVLLLTATPVVNRAADLVNLLRLFVADRGFAILGVPSLERALRSRAYGELAYVTDAAIVARSADMVALSPALPKVLDGPVIRSTPVPHSVLADALRLVDALEFPTFTHAREAALLRMHLLYRLASSPQACIQTARRHLAYAGRALVAARRGQTLSRRTARILFGADEELQLELDDLCEPGPPTLLDVDAVEADRTRLRKLLGALRRADGDSPKLGALAELLARRGAAKTIVFTGTVATARAIAGALGWKRVAVVAAGRAWIASGAVSVHEALGLFAPMAQHRSPPREAVETTTLIATDLASEGLDLQDADAVVHYDLPWNPVRLEQRQGRIVRLGSAHGAARVYWFAPPPAVERRLRLQGRIAEKARCQLSLSVVTTSRVGQAGVVNRSLAIRERFVSTGHHRRGRSIQHAVVRAPLGAVVAVFWNLGAVRVPELLVLWGKPLGPVRDYDRIEPALRALLSSPDSPHPAPEAVLDLLVAVLRQRSAWTHRGAVDPTSRRLARQVIRRAYIAGHDRRADLVALFDLVLDRVRAGLRAGSERRLRELSDREDPAVQLRRWLRHQPRMDREFGGFELRAALIGDGSRPVD